MDRKKRVKSQKRIQSDTHPHDATYELFILVLTIFSLAVVALILIWPGNKSEKTVLLRVDFLICVIFFFDFLLNLWRAPKKADYFFKKGGWLDLLGSIPAVPGLRWTALLRLARLNRALPIAKHLQGKDRDEVFEEARKTPARTALLTIILAAIVLITISSLLILPLERGAAGAEIRSGADAFWWSFVTVTTVGYGDYTPVTFPGRVLAMVLMTFGIGIFAVLTSFVAARVVVLQDSGEDEDLGTLMKEENATIRAELTELKQLLQQQGSMNDDESH